MSKSHRIPLKGGHEQNMLTGWRKVLCHGSGAAKAAKRQYNRRQRKALKPNLEED